MTHTLTRTTVRPRLSLDVRVVRPLLAADAAGCLLLGATGVLGATRLDGALGTSVTLLVVTGVVLLAYALEAGLVARRPSRTGLLVLAGVNAVFAGGAVLVLATVSLTGWGSAVALSLTAVSLVVADALVLGARALDR